MSEQNQNPDEQGFMRQRPQGPYAPYQPGYTVPPAAPKKTHRTRNILLGVGGGFLALVVIGAALGSGKQPATPAAATDTTTAATTEAAPAPVDTTPVTEDTTVADDPATADTSTAPTVPAQVTYKCTGNAPDGIDITYGPDGSSYSASGLPFSKTMPLDDSAQYFNVTAQLSGSGHVSCSTTVQTSDGTQTVKNASASGGYNIAMAEVCSSWDGTYEAC